MIVAVVDFLAQIIGLMGVGIILWGVFLNFLRFVVGERQWLMGRSLGVEREAIRRSRGFYLLLGLEFLIAADMIRTISRPSLREVAVLGGIVLIRTVISFSLDRGVGLRKGKRDS